MPDEQHLTTKIGHRLRAVRKDHGLSLQGLSDQTGGRLSKSPISNYEQGLRRLGIEEAQILAQALGTVSATYLLCLDDEGFLNGQEQDLLRWFRETDMTADGVRFYNWRRRSQRSLGSNERGAIIALCDFSLRPGRDNRGAIRAESL